MKTKTTYLIELQALLFAAFLLVTFYFNRFAVDDFYFIGELNSSSFSNIYSHLYFNWHGRWTSNFLLIGFFKFSKLPLFLMLYNTFSVGLLYFGILRLAGLINTYFKLNFDKQTTIIYSVIFLAVLFFCTISANDVWLWYTSSVVYLWSTTAFFWGTAIFFKHQKKVLDFLLLGIGAIYIGGSNEPLTFFSILILTFLILKRKEKLISLIAIMLLTSSFLINYLSPGTLHRDAITPSLSFIDWILYAGYGTLKFLFFTIYKTFIPALFLGFPFYLLGGKINYQINKKFNPLKVLIKSFVIIGMVVFLNQLIVVYALGGLAPDRSSIVASVIIAFIMVYYLFLLGNYHQKKYAQLNFILVLNIIVLVGFNLYYANLHYQYATAIDKRLDFIKQNNENVICVKALPNSGYICSAEITNDATHFKNQHLKNGLGLKNDIVLVNEQ